MFDRLSGFIWMDGQFQLWPDAKCHIMTHALHYASSVYEGVRIYHGKAFYGREHYIRFHESAAYLDFKIPYSVEALLEATDELIARDNHPESYLRAIAWCGSKKMTVSHRDADVHVAIGIWPRPIQYPDAFYKEGIRMNIASWKRPHPETAPVHSKAAGLYMISSISKKNSEILGFQDALMLDYQDNIAEATSSNIFLVIEGGVYTPTPTCFLNGITRQICLKIAQDLGFDTFETTLPVARLDEASEVFLTGTAIEMLPVGSIEGLGNKWSFQPGEVTHTIYRHFKEMIQKL
jgi:branched-chain amino acid aminotransferase